MTSLAANQAGYRPGLQAGARCVLTSITGQRPACVLRRKYCCGCEMLVSGFGQICRRR